MVVDLLPFHVRGESESLDGVRKSQRGVGVG